VQNILTELLEKLFVAHFTKKHLPGRTERNRKNDQSELQAIRIDLETFKCRQIKFHWSGCCVIIHQLTNIW